MRRAAIGRMNPDGCDVHHTCLMDLRSGCLHDRRILGRTICTRPECRPRRGQRERSRALGAPGTRPPALAVARERRSGLVRTPREPTSSMGCLEAPRGRRAHGPVATAIFVAEARLVFGWFVRRIVTTDPCFPSLKRAVVSCRTPHARRPEGIISPDRALWASGTWPNTQTSARRGAYGVCRSSCRYGLQSGHSPGSARVSE